MKIIKDNPDILWDWDGISWNPNVTWDIIKDNPDKNMELGGISLNSFKKEKE